MTDLNTSQGHQRSFFWFVLSLTFSALFSGLVMKEAFSGEYIIQDDARQFVSWLQQLQDPALFQQDLIADYFKSVTPIGYRTLYQGMSIIGIQPILLSKLLPMGLALITTGYCFGVCLTIIRVPFAGFLATLLLNQNLWTIDHFASATPRAFVYPLFLGFLYYLLNRSLLPCLGVIALQGLFYPPFVLISSGVLILDSLQWQNGHFQISKDWRDYRFCIFGLGIAFLVLLPYAVGSSEFGPTISAAEAKTMPEFLPGGRNTFFVNDFRSFWICGGRSGLIPNEWCKLPYRYFPGMFFAGLLLPVMVKFSAWFPLTKRITKAGIILPKIIVVSLGLYVASHLLLFKIHQPSRYAQHSLRMIMALTAGIALTVMVDGMLKWATKSTGKINFSVKPLVALTTIVLLGSGVILYPTTLKQNNIPFPRTNYIPGEAKEVYSFLRKQPKDSSIASISEEASSLPAFAQRSILASREYALPYHVGYYKEIRQRAEDMLRAQYSPDINEVRNFISKYQVDFWLLDRTAFSIDYLKKHGWIRQWKPLRNEVITKLEEGDIPAIKGLVSSCTVSETKDLILLEAACISQS